MKKILFLIVALLIVPVCVFAASIPVITKLDASVSKNEIKYNGETTDGMYAVMCKLLNTKDEELDLLSSPVSENKFDGTFTVDDNGEYKVACANYEGGEYKIATVNVGEVSKKEDNPKTGDNIINYVLLGIISLFGLSSVIYLKKREN